MGRHVFFDHIEVYVKDIPAYGEFLKKVFQGGRFRIVGKTGTGMFLCEGSPAIEVKQKMDDQKPVCAGFSLPCLRVEGAKDFIENDLNGKVTKTAETDLGTVYFFTDYEGITWHFKDYLSRDKMLNW